jgi:glycosyltransferase involved in cell wall biosynthesis
MTTSTSPTDLPSPLLTVIVAVFNGAATLQQCIDSVTSQTYPNKELVIIDGGSQDGTVEILKANQESISYWISEPDCGIYNAWNKGLAQAKGDWICFLGADDFFWNEKVLAQAAEHLIKLPPSIRVAYAKIMLLNSHGEEVYLANAPWEKTKDQFKKIMCIQHQGVMHRRSLFELHGKFDETFKIAGDYEFLLRELKASDASFIPNLVLTGMRQGGISSNPKNSLAMFREIRRAQRMHGFSLPSGLWLRVVLRVYLRLLIWKILGERTARKFLDSGRRVMGLPPFWTKT